MRKALVLVFCCFFAAACSSDDESALKKIKFEGIKLTSDSGFLLGTIGDTDLNDWSKNENLTQEEIDLISFEDPLGLEGTVISDIEPLIVFPNPNASMFQIQYSATGMVKFKMVVVNQQFEILETFSAVNDQALISFDTSNTTIYPDKTIVRVYYSFSAKDAPNFNIGHGDVLICRSSIQDCM